GHDVGQFDVVRAVRRDPRRQRADQRKDDQVADTGDRFRAVQEIAQLGRCNLLNPDGVERQRCHDQASTRGSSRAYIRSTIRFTLTTISANTRMMPWTTTKSLLMVA